MPDNQEKYEASNLQVPVKGDNFDSLKRNDVQFLSQVQFVLSDARGLHS